MLCFHLDLLFGRVLSGVFVLDADDPASIGVDIYLADRTVPVFELEMSISNALSRVRAPSL